MLNSLEKDSGAKERDLMIITLSTREAKSEVQYRDISPGGEDFAAVLETKTVRRCPYKRYTDKDYLAIGIYSENEAFAAVRKFCRKHPHWNGVWSMREKYQEELKKVGFEETASTITLKKWGRSLVLGKDIDSMV